MDWILINLDKGLAHAQGQVIQSLYQALVHDQWEQKSLFALASVSV